VTSTSTWLNRHPLSCSLNCGFAAWKGYLSYPVDCGIARTLLRSFHSARRSVGGVSELIGISRAPSVRSASRWIVGIDWVQPLPVIVSPAQDRMMLATAGQTLPVRTERDVHHIAGMARQYVPRAVACIGQAAV
jgi:hypothetical protein